MYVASSFTGRVNIPFQNTASTDNEYWNGMHNIRVVSFGSESDPLPYSYLQLCSLLYNYVN